MCRRCTLLVLRVGRSGNTLLNYEIVSFTTKEYKNHAYSILHITGDAATVRKHY